MGILNLIASSIFTVPFFILLVAASADSSVACDASQQLQFGSTNHLRATQLDELLDCVPFWHRNLSQRLGAFSGSWYLHDHSVGPVDLGCSNPLLSAAALAYCLDYARVQERHPSGNRRRAHGAEKVDATNTLLHSNEELADACAADRHSSHDISGDGAHQVRRRECQSKRRMVAEAVSRAFTASIPFQQASMMYELCQETDAERSERMMPCLGLTGPSVEFLLLSNPGQKKMQGLRCAIAATCGLDRMRGLCAAYLIPLFRRARFCVEEASGLLRRCRRRWGGFPEWTSSALSDTDALMRRLQTNILGSNVEAIEGPYKASVRVQQLLNEAVDRHFAVTTSSPHQNMSAIIAQLGSARPH